MIDIYTKAYDALPELVIMIDIKLIIIYINQHSNLLGYKQNELIGNRINLLFPNNLDKENSENKSKNIMCKNKEISIKTKSNTILKFYSNTSEIYIDNNLYFIGLFVKIRNNILINSALDIYNLINNNNNIVIIKIDLINLTILDTTENIVNLIGYTKIEIVNKYGLDFIHNDDIEKIKSILSTISKDKNINIRIRFKCRHKTKEWIWLEANGLGINNNIVVFSQRDITNEIEIEKKLMCEREKMEKNNTRRELLQYIFHEARGWMNTVTLGIDTLKSKCKSITELVDILTDIELANNNVSKIFDDTLTLEKLENGEFSYNKTSFQFNRLINLSIEGVKYMLVAKNINLINNANHTELTNIYLIGDLFRLSQCIRNYLINAAKYSKNNSNIILNSNILDLTNSFTTIKISVEDFGCGIKDIHRDLIFRKFKQVRNGSNQEAGGSGLGLSIVKKIIEDGHGGSVGFTSETNVGSIFYFTITFPITNEQSISPKANMNFNFDNFVLDKYIFTKDILIVDDVGTTRKIMSKFMTEHGYTTDLAENGLIALTKIQNGNKYKLILIDKEMPVLDGFSATKKIRETGYRLPIIGLTGNTFSDEIDQFILNGADQVLYKPLNILQFDNIKKDYLNKYNL